CKPPTYSLVGDYYPRAEERTRALSVYSTGNAISSLFAFVAGGWLNDRYGWRTAFFVMGVVGLVLSALLKSTVREPRIGRWNSSSGEDLPLRAVCGALWRNRSLRELTCALVLLYTVGLGLGPWNAAFMIRSHGMSAAELGLWLGLIMSAAGVVGILAGGYIA